MKRASRARPDEISLGWISGLFGVHGDARLFLHNRESDYLLGVWREVVLAAPDGARRAARLKARGGAGARVLASIEGVSEREAARALLEWEILIPRADLPEAGAGEYYHHQLIGLEVVDAAGAPLGRLVALHSPGEVDVWELRGGDGVSFLPARREFVAEVDLAGGRVVANEVIDGSA